MIRWPLTCRSPSTLRITMWSWCQLVLRILKVYRIDSTQDTFSIRLRSDMLSSERSYSQMNRFASVSWFFDLTCKRKPQIQQLQQRHQQQTTKKWRDREYGNWNSRFGSANLPALSVCLVSFCSASSPLLLFLAAWNPSVKKMKRKRGKRKLVF